MTFPIDPAFDVTVEELRNTVIVDQAAPNNVNVQINTTLRAGAVAIGYGSGAPWTIVVEI
jgi:hypothetical protein